jgi:hypothetical protein
LPTHPPVPSSSSMFIYGGKGKGRGAMLVAATPRGCWEGCRGWGLGALSAACAVLVGTGTRVGVVAWAPLPYPPPVPPSPCPGANGGIQAGWHQHRVPQAAGACVQGGALAVCRRWFPVGETLTPLCCAGPGRQGRPCRTACAGLGEGVFLQLGVGAGQRWCAAWCVLGLCGVGVLEAFKGEGGGGLQGGFGVRECSPASDCKCRATPLPARPSLHCPCVFKWVALGGVAVVGGRVRADGPVLCALTHLCCAMGAI